MDLRPATDDDREGILEVVAASLGWSDRAALRDTFAWKHESNPFGRSLIWVAVDRGRVVAVRPMMRWRFVRGSETIDAVRAVDTATHPEYRGRGLFSRLTLATLHHLNEEGVAFVFNTPNRQSRPGYLKMGWRVVGRLPIAARPLRVAALPRMLTARTSAGRDSEDISIGRPATEALFDGTGAADALASRQSPGGCLHTDHSPESVRWRYGVPAHRYRVVRLVSGPGVGLAIVRVRRRGRAREAVLAEAIGPHSGHPGPELASSLGAAPCDYALVLGRRPPGFVTVPWQGPRLTWRGVAQDRMPGAGEWHLSLGDVELF